MEDLYIQRIRVMFELLVLVVIVHAEGGLHTRLTDLCPEWLRLSAPLRLGSASLDCATSVTGGEGSTEEEGRDPSVAGSGSFSGSCSGSSSFSTSTALPPAALDAFRVLMRVPKGRKCSL